MDFYNEPVTFEYDDYTSDEDKHELRWKITYKSGKKLVVCTVNRDSDFIKYLLSKGAKYIENASDPDDRLENIWPYLADIIKKYEHV